MLAALVHDIVITVGVYSVSGREVTTATVAAVLTVLGYSIYDTIIIFDRVRENVPLMRRASFATIANVSLWETIRRSLATTFITLLPVASLLIFGGATLKDFAFALMVGIASGAYSSIFIAAPLLTMLKEREPEWKAKIGKTDVEGDSVSAAAVLREAELAAAAEPAPVTDWRRPRRTAAGTARSPGRSRSASVGVRAGGRDLMAAADSSSSNDAQPSGPLVDVLERLGPRRHRRGRADGRAGGSAGRRARESRRHAPRRGSRPDRADDPPLARRGASLQRARGGRARGLFHQFGLVSRSDFEELQLRVAQLEHRLRLVEGDSPTPAASPARLGEHPSGAYPSK